MSSRIRTLLTGLFALLTALLLALAPAGAKPASGGYQLFEPVASGHQAVISLAALENFDYHAKIAPECCNATKGGMIGGKTCVYSCVVDGTTRYVGITDDIARRGAEHLRTKDIKITGIRGLEGLSRSDARSVEQTLIHYYGLGKNGGTLLNKINSISPTKNPTAYESSLKRGKELLDSVDYQWTK